MRYIHKIGLINSYLSVRLKNNGSNIRHSSSISSDPVRKALKISLFVSLLILLIKASAFFVTGSTAALSDAVESVVHLFAVGFVVYGYYLSRKPPDDDHHYGHERIEFFSIGVEGAIIIAAGITILYHAIHSAIYGIEIVNTVTGIALLSGAGLINLALGLYVLRTGRKADNMIAVSNGKHILTDVWTSGGVIAALALIHYTGWLFIDIIVSLGVAVVISYEAYKLIRFSVRGLMDTRNPQVDAALKKVLKNDLPEGIKGWHQLRHRTSGNTTWIELHLFFEDDISLKKAHDEATVLERKMIDSLNTDAVITIHLEPHDAHDESHVILEGANKQKDLDEFA